MLSSDKFRLHFRRFEFKYRVPRAIADRIIPQILNYMEWDQNVADKTYYEVNSIYMDSPEFKLYYEKIDGVMNRKKVRIRSYAKQLNEDSKLFFELKRRSGEVILKDRMVVDLDSYKEFFGDAFSLMSKAEYLGDFLNEFLWEFSSNRMKPVVAVSYKRKPFISKFDPDFRVTFDYEISYAIPDKDCPFEYNLDYANVTPDLVVMEVKFNGAMPRWFHDIIEEYNLVKDTFSKYCHGVETIYNL